MENASKALIIAGAILISILLISVGIMVMNSINDPLDQATDSAKGQAVEMFNSKFTGYSGKQRAASVKALMTAIQSSNGANASNQIGVSAAGINGATAEFKKANIAKVQAGLDTQKNYNVEFLYSETGATSKDDGKGPVGYIIGVTIKEV